jgi:WhiB family redox-sensing transcriptional regulator
VLIAEYGTCATAAQQEAWWPHARYDAPGLERARRTAAELCAGCPVLAQCRAYALEAGEEHGTWGGLTEMDRDQLGQDGARLDGPGAA